MLLRQQDYQGFAAAADEDLAANPFSSAEEHPASDRQWVQLSGDWFIEILKLLQHLAPCRLCEMRHMTNTLELLTLSR